ncbi:MAG: twin-arginine translocase subunit TatC [Bacteroidales bacterium]|nr:twin-arginine translocase subunit TatC [Bacteroidales bacterium]MBQ7818704.1 twin-arginine translocase subunit TatC [Bacteroidales bacterium]
MTTLKTQTNNNEMTFWEHVDVLRKIIFRCLFVWLSCSIGAFIFKEELFKLLFAPSQDSFILYKTLCWLSEYFNIKQICPDNFEVNFISTQLASQFMIHLKVSMCIGAIIALPFLIYQLYCFISPALYKSEKRYSHVLIFSSVLLFSLGVVLNYFLIFPLSFRFLGTYQVSELVVNQITLNSYISTFLILSLLLGIVFEIPILAYFMAKLGVIDSLILKKYRKHAIIVICIISAIITPTADIVTLCLVSLPIWLLYEISIYIVKKVAR